MKRALVLVVVVVALGLAALRNRKEPAGDVAMNERTVAAETSKRADAGPTTGPEPEFPRIERYATDQPTTTAVATSVGDDPLPPLDEPFAQHLDELRRRASEGDAPAACRLGMELFHCAQLDESRAALAADLADAEGDDPAQRKGITWFQEAVATMEMRCRGVAPLDPLEAFRAQLAAARGGVVQSQLQLAAFPPLADVDVIDHPEVWREWRAAALPALESALAAGDRRAAYKLASAYEQRFASPFTPRLAPEDPYRAYTYRRLVTLLAQRSGSSNLQREAADEEKAAATLTEAQRRAAATEAQRLFDRYFAALPPDTTDGSLNGDDFAACER